MYNEKNEGFSIRDIFIQLLFIILFVFILVWLFPTKSNVNNQFADVNSRLDALTSGIFNDNLQTMKDAAVSYYTNERLPVNINDVDSMTLREMINKKLLVEFTDGNGKSCDLDGSYVEIIKFEEEYQLKINLSCTDNDAYIIVHLGCYDYCEATGVCEKEETVPVTTNPIVTPIPTKTCVYEYKMVVDGTWGNYGSWSSWTSNVITSTDYRVVETKTERVITGTKVVQTGTKVETKPATSSTTTYCPTGYTKNAAGTACERTATAYYYSKCPTGYTLNGGVCYGTQTITTSTDPVCPEGYPTRNGTTCYKSSTSTVTAKPNCPDSTYTLVGNTCTKQVTSGSTTTYVKDPSRKITTITVDSKPINTKDRFYENVGTTLVYACQPTCMTVQKVIVDVYGTIAVTTGGETTTVNVAASCANYPGYSLINGLCYKSTPTTETASAKCPSGYNELTGTLCYTSTTKTITISPSCPTGFTLNATGDRCYGTVPQTASLLTTTSYSCDSGYSLNGTSCAKTVPVFEEQNVYSDVTYYRYKERTYISGTVKTIWSKSENDTALISQGYSLTGNKKCS